MNKAASQKIEQQPVRQKETDHEYDPAIGPIYIQDDKSFMKSPVKLPASVVGSKTPYT